jgi:hypothetical protein
MTWTGGRLSIDLSVTIMTVGLWAAATALVVVFGLAIAGCTRPSSSTPTTHRSRRRDADES